MATSTTARNPDTPVGSSPLVKNGQPRLVGWFQEISSVFLASLSPAGADVYDTGWKNITLNSGFVTSSYTPVWAREGKHLELRGGIAPSSGGFPTSGVDVGTVGFTPPYELLGTVSGPGEITGKVRITAAGRMTIWGPASGGLTYARLDGLSWKIA